MFSSLNCQTIFVSFGNQYGASKWLVDTDIDLDMITDETRVLYKFFDLKVSYSMVWNTTGLIYYAEQVALNRALPQKYQDVEDDPHQMGGNFILQFDSNNKFSTVFSYASKTPPDRPSPDILLEFLREN